MNQASLSFWEDLPATIFQALQESWALQTAQKRTGRNWVSVSEKRSAKTSWRDCVSKKWRSDLYTSLGTTETVPTRSQWAMHGIFLKLPSTCVEPSVKSSSIWECPQTSHLPANLLVSSMRNDHLCGYWRWPPFPGLPFLETSVSTARSHIAPVGVSTVSGLTIADHHWSLINMEIVNGAWYHGARKSWKALEAERCNPVRCHQLESATALRNRIWELIVLDTTAAPK